MPVSWWLICSKVAVLIAKLSETAQSLLRAWIPAVTMLCYLFIMSLFPLVLPDSNPPGFHSALSGRTPAGVRSMWAATGTTAATREWLAPTASAALAIRTRTSGPAWHIFLYRLFHISLSERTLPLGRKVRKTIVVRLVAGGMDARVRRPDRG